MKKLALALAATAAASLLAGVQLAQKPERAPELVRGANAMIWAPGIESTEYAVLDRRGNEIGVSPSAREVGLECIDKATQEVTASASGNIPFKGTFVDWAAYSSAERQRLTDQLAIAQGRLAGTTPEPERAAELQSILDNMAAVEQAINDRATDLLVERAGDWADNPVWVNLDSITAYHLVK